VSEIELHRKLLGDAVRNAALAEALKRAITPGCTMADIGAGTGFLSFLARRLGASHCHLYEYSGALALARELARRNRITNLTFVEAHSREVKKPGRADVVISETLGNFALEEGLLETLVDARRFLKPGGILIPGRLRQYAAPVVSPRLHDEIDIWPRVGHDLDFAPTREMALNNMYVRTVRQADLAGAPAARSWDEIDLSPAARRPPAGTRSGTARWAAAELKADRIHGFALWWEVELVPGVVISTSPYEPPTHWEQVYLPLLHAVALEPGDELGLDLRSDTRAGVRLIWETQRRRAGRVADRQRQDLARGRL
jgi:protein arginine N-methyltransferase 1